MSPPAIVLTTRTVASATGVSRAALDVALALSQRASELRIRAWVPNPLPAEVDGCVLRGWVWEPVSPLVAASAVLRGEAPPRALLEHARRVPGLARRRLLPRTAARLEVVNGLGAHALYVAQGARGVTSAIVVHESPRHFDEPGARLDRAGACAALRGYDYRVFVSERAQQEWEALAALEPARSIYIPNCVQERRVRAVAARERTAGEGLRVVCVGQVSPRKGQDVVLEALRSLPSGQVDFLGDCSSPWARALAAKHTSSSVRFLGNVSDAYERIHAADVLVLASRAEAFPLVVLEAMALGTCVIAAAVDGVTEQIVDEQSGLLFAREDAQGLAERLLRVAQDQPLRAALAQAARARYDELFTRARQLARWNDALRRMLAG